MRNRIKIFVCLFTWVSILTIESFSGIVYASEPTDALASDATTSDAPVFQPKIIVTKSVTNPKNVKAGQEFKLSVTIKNTSNSMEIRDITITVAPPTEQLALSSVTDSVFVKKLKVEKELTVTYKLKAKETIEKGQYLVPLTFEYADTNGTPYTATGNARVNINQGAKKEIGPNVIVTKSVTNPENVKPGEEFDLRVTCKNVSENKALMNMTIMIAPPVEQFALCDSTDSIYLSKLGAGSKKTFSYKLKARSLVENGQYIVPLTFSYVDDVGTPSTVQGNARVNIKSQNVATEIKLNFDNPIMPSEAQVGEIINLDVGIQNLSKVKVCNVRAVVEADGLSQMETLYVGEIEPRTSTTASSQITVSGLKDSSSAYGITTGTITFYYEDESGKEYSEVKELTLDIRTPFSNEETVEKDKPAQWWIIISVIGVILAGFLVIFLVRKFYKREGA